MSTLYTAVVTAHGGREGRATSSDKILDVPLAMATELGGKGGAATNPEQLFAAGYAACFESAIRLVSRAKQVALRDVKVTAQVALHKTEAEGFFLSAELCAAFADLDRSKAEELVAAAHQVCPYSKAIRGNVDVTLAVE
ncbi:MAG: organic hydroperoxide resistance protein [Myxococcales bacterium]|nr:organic hydroperoxide resistance protein [Myxococcales bacterium]